MILWINDKIEREAVICALFNNGYAIRKIERPNEKWPITMVDYGIEIMTQITGRKKMDDLDFYNAVADPANKLTQDAITALMKLFQKVEELEGAKNTERRKMMTVKELSEKLAEYNQNATVQVVAHSTMSDFDITYGTSEGCEKSNCDTVFFDSHLFEGSPEKSGDNAIQT